MDKTLLSAADLFVILDREFRKRKARECRRCFVSLPYRVDTTRQDEPNWQVLMPEPCPWHCADALADIVKVYRPLYRLA